jgi:hypothetical protein
LTSGVTKAFTRDALEAGGTMVGGAIVNSMVRDALGNMLGLGSESWLRFGLGLGTAGLLGMGVNQVLPGRGNQAFMGAVTFELARLYNEKVSDLIGLGPKLGDFLQQPQVAGAVPSPMGDFLVQPQVAGAVPAPLGGFLDPYHQPGMLGMGDMGAIAEEMGQQDAL